MSVDGDGGSRYLPPLTRNAPPAPAAVSGAGSVRSVGSARRSPPPSVVVSAAASKSRRAGSASASGGGGGRRRTGSLRVPPPLSLSSSSLPSGPSLPLMVMGVGASEICLLRGGGGGVLGPSPPSRGIKSTSGPSRGDGGGEPPPSTAGRSPVPVDSPFDAASTGASGRADLVPWSTGGGGGGGGGGIGPSPPLGLLASALPSVPS